MAEKSSIEFQKEIRESAHRIWLAGLGALASAEEEGTKLFKSLVEKGESYEFRGKERLDKVLGKFEEAKGKAKGKAEAAWEKVGGSFEDKVADTLKRLGVPSREEIKKLTKRVEELTLKVDRLKPKTSASKVRKTA
ncbi:MAG: phasin family protein [Thermoanaerobaculia bacterium]